MRRDFGPRGGFGGQFGGGGDRWNNRRGGGNPRYAINLTFLTRLANVCISFVLRTFVCLLTVAMSGFLLADLMVLLATIAGKKRSATEAAAAEETIGGRTGTPAMAPMLLLVSVMNHEDSTLITVP